MSDASMDRMAELGALGIINQFSYYYIQFSSDRYYKDMIMFGGMFDIMKKIKYPAR